MAKEFAWSYSKMKNYVACPKRHYEVDIAKSYTDSTEQLDWGNAVHKAIAGACLLKAGLPAVGTGRDRVEPAPLPDTMKDYQPWVDRYADPALPGKLYVEQKYALTRAFQPTPWFANNVWLRVICDLLRIDGPVARAADWKTGKPQHDSRQLMLVAQGIFVQFPAVRRVYTEFIWLKEGTMDAVTPEVFNRGTIAQEWPPVLTLAKDMEHAAATLTYPPKPNRLCARYCPVTSCPFHGKRHS